jgi:hypothetical protein
VGRWAFFASPTRRRRHLQSYSEIRVPNERGHIFNLAGSGFTQIFKNHRISAIPELSRTIVGGSTLREPLGGVHFVKPKCLGTCSPTNSCENDFRRDAADRNVVAAHVHEKLPRGPEKHHLRSFFRSFNNKNR